MKTKSTQVWEDYLRAIYVLQMQDRNPVSSISLARHMGLAKSTISERIKDMSRAGLVESARYQKILLTEAGMKRARELTFKHRVIETFLHEKLGVPLEKIHVEAHKLEHAFSLSTVKRLHNYIGNPDTDPHGSPIEL